MTRYVQCRMEQQTPDGLAVTVGYIEERGAKVGARVELKGEDGLWTVVSAGGHPVEAKQLRTKQASDRVAFKSLVDA